MFLESFKSLIGKTCNYSRWEGVRGDVNENEFSFSNVATYTQFFLVEKYFKKVSIGEISKLSYTVWCMIIPISR